MKNILRILGIIGLIYSILIMLLWEYHLFDMLEILLFTTTFDKIHMLICSQSLYHLVTYLSYNKVAFFNKVSLNLSLIFSFIWFYSHYINYYILINFLGYLRYNAIIYTLMILHIILLFSGESVKEIRIKVSTLLDD